MFQEWHGWLPLWPHLASLNGHFFYKKGYSMTQPLSESDQLAFCLPLTALKKQLGALNTSQISKQTFTVSRTFVAL